MNSSKDDIPSSTSTSHDPRELEEWSAIQGWELQYLPLKPRSFEARFRDLELPCTLLQQESWSMSLQLLGTIRDDVVPIALPLGSCGIFQSIPFNSGDLIFMRPGSDLNLLAQSPIELITLHVPKNYLENVGWNLGIHNPMDLLSSSPVAHSSPCVRKEFAKDMTEMFRIPPELQSTREELESQILYLFWESLKKQVDRKGGLEFSPRARLRAVKGAQEFIEENLEGTIRIEEMSAASGVSTRVLQLCFRTYFQMGPQEYVRLRRLYLVRKALQLASPDSLTVTQVAMAHGFYHLSRFSMYYKNMFGESPSTTLRSRPRSHMVSVPA